MGRRHVLCHITIQYICFDRKSKTVVIVALFEMSVECIDTPGLKVLTRSYPKTLQLSFAQCILLLAALCFHKLKQLLLSFF